MSKPFWETKTLEQMSRQEWESLCDGCGKCCLHKLEDEDTGIVHYTDVVCQYLDDDACQCTHYLGRCDVVENCVWLTPETVREFTWLPNTCAYRLVAEQQPLPDWHYLVSGSKQSIHDAGMSVRGQVFNELDVTVDEMEDHVIRWVTYGHL